MVSSAYSQFYSPLRGIPRVSRLNVTAGAPITLTFYTLTDGVTLTDGDFWPEVSYFGSASYPLGSIASSAKANILATATAYDTTTQAWTTTGLTSPVRQAIELTFTPQHSGLVDCRAVPREAIDNRVPRPARAGIVMADRIVLTPDGILVETASAIYPAPWGVMIETITASASVSGSSRGAASVSSGSASAVATANGSARGSASVAGGSMGVTAGVHGSARGAVAAAAGTVQAVASISGAARGEQPAAAGSITVTAAASGSARGSVAKSAGSLQAIAQLAGATRGAASVAGGSITTGEPISGSARGSLSVASGSVLAIATCSGSSSGARAAAAGSLQAVATCTGATRGDRARSSGQIVLLWLGADSIRLFDGADEVRHLMALETLPGVAVRFASGANGPGTARLRYDAAGGLAYRAPGSAAFGPIVTPDPDASAPESIVLHDGEDRDALVRCDVYLECLPPVATQADVSLADVHNNPIGRANCAAADALAGETISYEITCRNVAEYSATSLRFWVTEPAAYTIEISADGSIWSTPTSEATALVLGDVAPDATRTLHVRRTIAPATDAAPSLLTLLHGAFGQMGFTFTLDARGRFRVFNAAGYNFHFGSLVPDEDDAADDFQRRACPTRRPTCSATGPGTSPWPHTTAAWPADSIRSGRPARAICGWRSPTGPRSARSRPPRRSCDSRHSPAASCGSTRSSRSIRRPPICRTSGPSRTQPTAPRPTPTRPT